MKALSTILTSIAVLGCMAFVQADQDKSSNKKSAKAMGEPQVIANQLPSYPLDTCPVSDESLDAMGGAVDVVVEGRLVRVCCKSCTKRVKADPAKYIAGIDAAVIKQQTPGYPMMECPISGAKLGSMGKPIQLVHGTRLVQLCCKGCVKGFKKNPAKTMAKLDAALIEQQKKTYAMKTCLVSGDELVEGEAVDYLYGTKLMRVCCKACIKAIKKKPAKYVAMLK